MDGEPRIRRRNPGYPKRAAPEAPYELAQYERENHRARTHRPVCLERMLRLRNSSKILYRAHPGRGGRIHPYRTYDVRRSSPGDGAVAYPHKWGNLSHVLYGVLYRAIGLGGPGEAYAGRRVVV